MNKFDLFIHKKVNDRTVTYDPKTLLLVKQLLEFTPKETP